MRDFTNKEMGMLQRLVANEVSRLKEAKKNDPTLDTPFYNEALETASDLWVYIIEGERKERI